jgi:hypothetical protein
MMDDDGYSLKNYLEKLLLYTSQHDYVIPVSIHRD